MSLYLNGRPQSLGGIFHEEGRLKFNVGYCPNCKRKLGLTSEELEELSFMIPSRTKTLIWKLMHLKVVIPH